MKIIIVGDGKVGFTLAEHLSKEDHDVTIVDMNDAALKRASDTLDVMCVKGNGAAISVLRDAGTDSADIVIAATNLDAVSPPSGWEPNTLLPASATWSTWPASLP